MKTRTRCIRIPDDLWEAVGACAASVNITPSLWVRYALSDAVDHWRAMERETEERVRAGGHE